MDFVYPIEKEYKLEKLQSQNGKNIIIQNKEYIFYYIYTNKTNNNKIYKCSYYKDKKYPCKAYIILNNQDEFIQNDYNLEHSGHNDKDDKAKYINTLFAKKEINNILQINQIYMI